MGIAGEVSVRGAWADTACVDRMIQAMDAARDASGSVDPGICDWGWVAVGHRPPETGDQAGATAELMLDERLGWCLVFDGQLDNGPGLREELDECFPFRSGSDAEVVLAAYHRWGERFVDHLQGVFALALVDAPREKVLLARDRQGSRPLYVCAGAGRLRFASTLPGLLAAGGIDTSADRTGLGRPLDHRGMAPASRTVLSGVAPLPAATLRVLEARGRARDRVYGPDGHIHHGREGRGWRVS
ncbi:hypothetical protein GCM10010977_23860 [Citricoccus zhacaiensis]|uniref:asparagine synthase (glutamine-hydrolyzing) n=1 Tax=Citricoccus zhacaiensis TaxID=489142 RepID=A0ABQ2M578_9MICC|nr:hypothetical protein [Citricoccus zhacaiensis]GGO47194.1 hypothetical protein GCM10010977_23860 [Citricoccus zhacaiensis]